MELGFPGEAFGNLLILLAFIALILVTVVSIITHKRGVDITIRRFQLTVGMRNEGILSKDELLEEI